MSVEHKVDEIFRSYQNRVELLLEEMKVEILALTGLEEISRQEITLGEARKVAILTECLNAEEQSQEITRSELSAISKKYMRSPATCGVFFRPDVNLMETRGGDGKLRFVTEKARILIEEYRRKFGTDWIERMGRYLIDPNLPDDYKFKFEIIKGDK